MFARLRLASLAVGLLAVGVFSSPTLAQPSTTTDAALQSPAQFLGYELGEQFTPHHRVVDYVRHVADASPNVQLQQYGTTNEGRPLLLTTVASPENQDRIEQIRQDNLRRTGLLDGEPQGDPTAVVWLSYNVHGNESVSTEAALQTLYDLANPNDERTQPWLENTVVLLDPCLNPDGRERYVQWYKRTVGEQFNARPEAREHHEPWPGGRTNHYYFDLNRDWAWGVQKETRHRLAVYHDWMPHVHVDFHEQGVNEPYYFAPAAEPFHEDITSWQREFQTTIGENNARYFDRNDWLYFTREVFDLFYPGYGDTWPIFNGAIGMTYEQGGSGRAGLAIVTAEGDTLTLADRIEHHYTTGLSTVEATSDNHERVVQEFEAYYDTAQQDPPGEYRSYVVKRDAGGDRLDALVAHLDRQQIDYGFAGSTREARGTSYETGSETSFAVQRGDLVVPAAQPKGRLAKVLMEPQTTIIDSLTYDITAWALPYAYGLDAYASEDRVAADGSARPGEQGVTGAGESPYAYVTRWSSRDDLTFLTALLKQDVSVRFAVKPFTMNGQKYAPGTLIVTRNGNDRPDFDRIVRDAAEAHGQPLMAAATGFVDEGPDFGSANVGFVDAPHVAVIAGEPTSSYSLGQVWHYFDQQIEYPLTLLPADDFEPSMLDDVDVLILPEGSYGEWWTDARGAALQDWLQGGGRLIAIGSANGALSGRTPFSLSEKEMKGEGDESAEEGETGSTQVKRYGDQERAFATRATPGSVHTARIDTSHPLGFGVPAPYFTLKRSSAAYGYLENGWNVATLDDGTPRSGFMGHEAQKAVAETLVFGTESVGDGNVVYLIDDPLFRGFWYGGHLVFGNAVFMVGND